MQHKNPEQDAKESKVIASPGSSTTPLPSLPDDRFTIRKNLIAKSRELIQQLRSLQHTPVAEPSPAPTPAPKSISKERCFREITPSAKLKSYDPDFFGEFSELASFEDSLQEKSKDAAPDPVKTTEHAYGLRKRPREESEQLSGSSSTLFHFKKIDDDGEKIKITLTRVTPSPTKRSKSRQ